MVVRYGPVQANNQGSKTMSLQHQTAIYTIPPRVLRTPSVPEKSEPNPIDIHVGHRLRARRTLLGLSQEKVGEAMGLTFQQVQKYERGANRIGASRLWDMSRILNCPISYFFDEIDENTANASPRNENGAAEQRIAGRRSADPAGNP